MLIGPVSTDVSRLQAIDNVSLKGCLPHDELPRYSQYWTAAIMPLRAGFVNRLLDKLEVRERLSESADGQVEAWTL